MAEPLSPAAQAVLDAATMGIKSIQIDVERQCLAAALRAAADQVVPEPSPWEIGVLSTADREIEIRSELLAIAAELEGSDG